MHMQQHNFVAGGHRLGATSWGRISDSRPTIVMMHGGLDCTTTWKDLPQAIATATGLAVLSYDRFGYGKSDRLDGGRIRAYRHEEAGPVLGDLFRHFGISSALLFGHSDGGAMAVLGAAAHPSVVRAVCTCSPTIAFDAQTVRSMANARDAFEHHGLRERLARHHGANTESMFWSWYEAWSGEDAVNWSMADRIAAVTCPVAAVFGREDEYGWRPSAHALVEHGAMALDLLALPGIGHDPQHRARGAVLDVLRRLTTEIRAGA